MGGLTALQRPARRPLRWHRLWSAIGAVGLLALVGGSLMHHPPKVFSSFAFEDKILHFAAYGGLMWWYGMVYLRRRTHLLVAILLAGVGVLLELGQRSGGYRSFDYVDILADLSGIAAGIAAAATPLGRGLQLLERAAGVSK